MSQNSILYYSRGACSWAPHIVLEELGVPFEARRIDATKGENRTPEYLKLHPRAHVPVLVEGDFVLTECAAILVHVIVVRLVLIRSGSSRGELRA